MEDLAAFVRTELGPSLREEHGPARADGPSLTGWFMGLHVSVFAATGFDDDAGIRFSEFSAAIGVSRFSGEGDADTVEAFASAVTCLLGMRLKTKLNVDNLVVKEMWSVVANFSGDPLFGRMLG